MTATCSCRTYRWANGTNLPSFSTFSRCPLQNTDAEKFDLTDLDEQVKHVDNLANP